MKERSNWSPQHTDVESPPPSPTAEMSGRHLYHSLRRMLSVLRKKFTILIRCSKLLSHLSRVVTGCANLYQTLFYSSIKAA